MNITDHLGQDRCINLTDYSLIKVSGEDARDFLSAQLANDISLLSDRQFQTSCWCDPKGRVLAEFRLFLWQQDYYLLLAADLTATILKRLTMFVLRSRVDVQDVSDSLELLAWSGLQVDSRLRDAGLTLPEQPGQIAQDGQQAILSLPGVISRYLRVAQTPAADTGLPAQDVSAFHLLDIASGIPHISATNSGDFLPQMLNLDLLSAVSFNKGCYPGQEIVTRLQHRGGLKQRCYLFQVSATAEDVIEPGLPVVNAQQEKIGTVLNAETGPDGIVLLLAVIKIAAADQECWLDGHTNGLSRQDTPYPITDA